MKKVIPILLVLAGVSYLYAPKLISYVKGGAKDTLNKIKITVNSIRNIAISGGKFTANVSLNIKNENNIDLTASSVGLVNIYKLEFYTHKGRFIGTAFPNITEIQIGALQTFTTNEIPVEVPLSIGSIQVALDLAQNTTDIKVVTTLKILDNQIII